MDQTPDIQQRLHGFFPGLLGIRILEAAPGRVVGELTVRDELCTVPGILHGGVLMSLADTLGAVGTVLNMPPEARTTTIESKTNFFGPARLGAVVTAECVPLHLGKRTMVWQTDVRSPEGKRLALVTQTQFVDLPV